METLTLAPQIQTHDPIAETVSRKGTTLLDARLVIHVELNKLPKHTEPATGEQSMRRRLLVIALDALAEVDSAI
jgi:hypothetical protein